MLRSKKCRNLPLVLPALGRLVVLSLALFGLLIAAPWSLSGQAGLAWAESSPPPIETPAAAEATNRAGVGTDAISPETVSQFVRAYLHVVTLIEQREGELQGAETDAESLRVQQEIEAKALSLIAAEGLTLQEYMQLLSLANIDPEFGDRIALQLQEAVD